MSRSLSAEELSNAEMYGYLAAAVAPRPICFASTVDAAGRVNLSPYSFFNVFSSNPPVMVFSPVRSGRDGSTKNTLDNVLETREVVINVVNYPMVEQMSLASTAYEKGVNEFIKAGFTMVASEEVRAPRVGESPVSFECKVDQVIPLGEEGGAGNLVLARVLRVHVKEEMLGDDDRLDTQKLDLVARMGSNWYCRASGEALFEIPKPTRTIGMGVDALPAHVRESSVLTGNNLGRLGTAERLPTPEEVAGIRDETEVRQILESDLDLKTRTVKLHQLARGYLEVDDQWNALRALLLEPNPS